MHDRMAAPAEIDSDVLDAARVAGRASGRSAGQQASYWARLGKQLEDSGDLHPDLVAQVLAGGAGYDQIGAVDQAAVRAAWDEAVPSTIATLDYRAQFLTAGEEWSEADDSGNLIVRGTDED